MANNVLSNAANPSTLRIALRKSGGSTGRRCVTITPNTKANTTLGNNPGYIRYAKIKSTVAPVYQLE
jgi:hypothetical protein